MNKKSTIIAHAGFEKTAPNTMDSIKKAVELHIDFIKVDIRYDFNIVYLSHDKLDIDMASKALALKDLLIFAKENNLKLNLDLKNPDGLNPTLRILSEEDFLNNVFFTGAVFPNATAIYDFKYFLNIENIENSPYIDKKIANHIVTNFKELSDTRCLGLYINYSYISKKALEILQLSDIKIFLWTIDSKFALKRYLKMKIDYISTNRPVAASRIKY